MTHTSQYNTRITMSSIGNEEIASDKVSCNVPLSPLTCNAMSFHMLIITEIPVDNQQVRLEICQPAVAGSFLEEQEISHSTSDISGRLACYTSINSPST